MSRESLSLLLCAGWLCPMDSLVLLQQGLRKGLSRSALHLWVLAVVLSVWPHPQLQLTQFCLFSGKFRFHRLDYLKKKKKKP